MRKFFLILTVVLGISFLTLSTSGMHFMQDGSGMIMASSTADMGDMDHQPIHGAMKCIFQGVCIMSPVEHLRHFKELFSASFGGTVLGALALVLAVLLFKAHRKRFELFLREFTEFLFERMRIFSRLEYEQAPRPINSELQTFVKRHPRLHA